MSLTIAFISFDTNKLSSLLKFENISLLTVSKNGKISFLEF